MLTGNVSTNPNAGNQSMPNVKNKKRKQKMKKIKDGQSGQKNRKYNMQYASDATTDFCARCPCDLDNVLLSHRGKLKQQIRGLEAKLRRMWDQFRTTSKRSSGSKKISDKPMIKFRKKFKTGLSAKTSSSHTSLMNSVAVVINSIFMGFVGSLISCIIIWEKQRRREATDDI